MKCLVAFAAFIFINIMTCSFESEDCYFISIYFKNKKIFVLNETKTVELLPTHYSYEKTSWNYDCINITRCNLDDNKIEYQGETLNSLSDTEYEISDEELNKSIYNSFKNNEIFK